MEQKVIKMLGFATMLALIGASLHAFDGPVRKEIIRSKERLSQLHQSHQDLARSRDELRDMQEDLALQAADIAKQEAKVSASRKKLEVARTDLQSKWLIPPGLRASLYASFKLQAQLLDKLDVVMQRSKQTIAYAQEHLPALRQTVNELYVETGKLQAQGRAFVGKVEHPIRTIVRPATKILKKVPFL